MADYTIDKLQLDILVNSTGAPQKLNAVATSLTQLNNAVNSLDTTKFDKINSSLAGLATSLSSGKGTTNWISSFTKAVDKFDGDAFAKKVDRMTESLTPLLSKVAEAQQGLSALSSVMSQGGGGGGTSESTSKKANKIFKTLNFAKIVGTLYFVRNITKRLADNIVDIWEYGNNYTETLNLWQVAFRNNLDTARDFVKEMNNAYGIAEETLMRYSAIFKNMLSALGEIDDQMSTVMSEGLMRMAIDFSSLYNVSLEDAMTKFQAVLSGQVRPIRSIAGFDITENTIFQLYQALGGTKTMRQLSQTEKRLLRILAVFQQMNASGAIGDMSKTLFNNANQIREMQSLFTDIKAQIGNIIAYFVDGNGILISINARLRAIREVSVALGKALGYTEKDFTQTGNDAQSMFEGANDEIDQIQKKLAGFDKFQTLSTSAGVDDNLAIDDVVTNALKNYKSLIGDNEQWRIWEKAAEWLEKFGFELEKIYDDENHVISFTVTNVDKIANKIKPVIEGFLAKVPDVLDDILTLAVSFGKVLLQLLPTLISISASVLKIIASIVGVFDKLDMLDDAIYAVITAVLIWKGIQLAKDIAALIPLLEKLGQRVIYTSTKWKDGCTLMVNQLKTVNLAVGALTAAVSAFAFTMLFNWVGEQFGQDAKRIAGAIGIVIGAVTALIVAWAAYQNVMSWGVALPIIGAAIGAAIAGVKAQLDDIPKFAAGGTPTKGSLFYAGEAGAELVANTGGGNTSVLNLSQFREAVRDGFIEGWSLVADEAEESGQPIVVNISVGNKQVVQAVTDAYKTVGVNLMKR